MYEPRASDQELEMWGLTAEDVFEDVEIWPEHELAFAVFRRLNTQWAAGPNGPIGLKYESVYPLIDRYAPAQFDDVFDDIQVMEAEALNVMREK